MKEHQLPDIEATFLDQGVHLTHVLRRDLVFLAQALAEVGQQANAFEQVIGTVVGVGVVKRRGDVRRIALLALARSLPQVPYLFVFVFTLLAVLVSLLQRVLDLHVHHLDLLLENAQVLGELLLEDILLAGVAGSRSGGRLVGRVGGRGQGAVIRGRCQGGRDRMGRQGWAHARHQSIATGKVVNRTVGRRRLSSGR